MTTATEQLQGTYALDSDHSSIVFGVQHMGVSTFRATFADAEARLAAGANGLVLDGTALVSSVSITSPPEFRDHVVNGADFFHGGEHPAVRFRSTSIELGEAGEARIEGELTIKGISKHVAVTGSYQAPVSDPFGDVRAALELRAIVDRREWGMDWQMPLPNGGDALGYDVEITAHLEFKRES